MIRKVAKITFAEDNDAVNNVLRHGAAGLEDLEFTVTDICIPEDHVLKQAVQVSAYIIFNNAGQYNILNVLLTSKLRMQIHTYNGITGIDSKIFHGNIVGISNTWIDDSSLHINFLVNAISN